MDANTLLGIEMASFDVAKSLVERWTCRHCGHKTPTITEYCDGCGIEDCNHGTGEESARDRTLRLAGKRGAVGLWTNEAELASMALSLVKR